ncbi:putative structural protein [Escherichia phage smaasur]|uniref:Putative structural protein n=1 Tax=Escherichia phage smaasur TaxID=2696444 RepID=A0A6B9X859_9CAUD|nr:putative structural protein [Escherichia phage smaasur]
MGSVGKVFKGIGSVFGLGSQAPKYTIKTDPAQVKAQAMQANLAADLSNDNTPTIQSGGQVSSASDTLSGRRRRTGTGVASNLGIGS